MRLFQGRAKVEQASSSIKDTDDNPIRLKRALVNVIKDSSSYENISHNIE